MFGYDINNSDDLKKYLKEYHNLLYNYIENCDKNIKSLSMLAFNNKNIKMLKKEKYVFKIFRDYKKNIITIPTTISNINPDNIETHIDDFFKNQEKEYFFFGK